mmetsp:Transcript_24534/g.34237  ORF Transcript_24534/g.34237 Transcript_24534/m.34237 type:complete len:80 (-) Transcript_24534:25-264(-)
MIFLRVGVVEIFLEKEVAAVREDKTVRICDIRACASDDRLTMIQAKTMIRITLLTRELCEIASNRKGCVEQKITPTIYL